MEAGVREGHRSAQAGAVEKELRRVGGRATVHEDDAEGAAAGGDLPLFGRERGGVGAALAVLGAGRLASGSEDNTVKIWDVAAQRCVATLEGHRDWVLALAVLDAGRLASGSRDNTVKIWSAEGKANDETNESSKGNRNVSQADATETNESSMGNRK